MKQPILFRVLAITLIVGCISTSVYAVPTIELVGHGYGTTNGGEFNFKVISGGPVGINPTGSTFYTFCIETTEYIAYTGKYDVQLNTAAVYNDGGSGYSNPLDARTAYLFHDYVNGGLGTRTDTLANDVQKAIWYIENQTEGVNNYLVTQANTAVAVGGEWYGKGLGDVRVLNLWTTGHAGDYTYRAQDQLVIAVPAPGAILLGSIGISLVGWLKRRRTL